MNEVVHTTRFNILKPSLFAQTLAILYIHMYHSHSRPAQPSFSSEN